MKLTRRDLAAAMLPLAAGGGEPQTPEELHKSAAEDAGKAVREIREFKIAVTTEPAFQFRAQ